MSVYYTDEQITLHLGDALDVARTLDAGAVDCIVTSPPYYGLRDYGTEGQYGLEESPGAYVETLRALFAELRRVLADDGTCWLNLGDSYSGSWGDQGHSGKRGAQRPVNGETFQPHGDRYPKRAQTGSQKLGAPSAKNLYGIPWRVAFALQDDGWILRNAIIWHKPNAMPESVTDRLSGRYEHVFLFSKSARYWFDLGPIREPHITADRLIATRDYSQRPGSWASGSGGNHRSSGREGVGRNDAGRNPGDVWTLPTQPFPGAHFAVMPLKLAQRCILAGCAPRRCTQCGHVPAAINEQGPRVNRPESGSYSVESGRMDGNPHPSGGWHARGRATTGYTDCGHNAYRAGTVLDPFSGSGTTGLAAQRTGRRYVGVDLSAEYHDLALKHRLGQSALMFDDESGG